MPDLNLKGEEEPRPQSQEPSGHRRGAVLIGVFTGTLVVVIAVFAVVKLGLLQPQEREATQFEPQSSSKVDTFSHKVRKADTLATDSTGAQFPLASNAAPPESSSVSLADTSSRARGLEKFTIQLSAWRSAKMATEEVRRLKRLGFDVYLTQSEPDSVGKVWNRIRMGHYQTLDEAKRIAGRFLDTLVVGYTFEKEK